MPQWKQAMNAGTDCLEAGEQNKGEELMFQNEMEKLTQARQDFDRAVGDRLPNAREIGERCKRMALKLIEDVNESLNMSGTNVSEDTVEHARNTLSFARGQLEEVYAALRKLK